MPLSLWEISQELGREATGGPQRGDGLHVYSQRVGSVLEGAPVIDYTTEGTRASRLQRWDKLRIDSECLAAARFEQALRYMGCLSGVIPLEVNLCCRNIAVLRQHQTCMLLVRHGR